MAEESIPGIHSILIVDDDVHLSDLLQKRLASLGLDVGVVHTASEALAASAERSHNLYLMDIRVPGKNGVELAKELLAAHPRSRVIFMTAYEPEDLFRRMPEMAGWTLLTKPFKMVSIHEEIVKLLEYGGPNTRVRRKNVRT